jgi:hypothetical protein
VSRVTGTLPIIEAATTGTASDRLVDVITLIFMTSIRTLSRGASADAYSLTLI